MRHRAAIRRLVPVLVVIVALAVACGGGGADDDHDIPGVYIAVIRALAPNSSTVMPKSVYIEALPGTKLSLQDQAAIVQAFGEDTVVRFIDDRDEAVDPKSPGQPVRRDGVLLGMNPAVITERGLSIKTTRYVTVDNEKTTCLELEEQEHVWTVTSTRDC